MNTELGYTYSYLSFLMPKLKEGLVKKIILFGSVTRHELTKESDIDLFIEVYNEDKNEIVKKYLNLALTQFIKSDAYKSWKLRGVTNELKPLVGTLKEQSDLKRSLISSGIVLYGGYNEPIKGKNYVLVSIESIKQKNKRYRVFRKLFGRKEKEKVTIGMISKLGGEQISTRVFILPIEQTPIIIELFKKEKIVYSIKELTSD